MAKVLFCFLLGLFCAIEESFAQTVVVVQPGNGTLEQAILSSNPKDVLQLTGGGEYTLSTSASTFGIINKPLTIQVKAGSAEKAILKLASDASATKKYYFFTIQHGAALTLKGLEIHGICHDSAVASSMIIFDARLDPMNARIGNFRFEDCLFHDFKDYIVHGMKDEYARGMIQDSVFVNRVTVYHANHFLQYKHVSLRHLEMTNSTIYSLNGMALKIGKIGYRCVLLHPTQPYIALTDSTITPTGFIDHCTLNDMGDIHGHVQVDDAFHALTVSNCIVSNQQQFNQPALYFLEPRVTTAVFVKNTCFWKCAPPNSYIGGSQWIGYQFQDSITLNPGFRNPQTGDFTLPANSPLLTAGTDGGPIGDLRWITNTSSISNDRGGLFTTVQNYPNPFHSTTNIAFTLLKEAFVSIKIFNASGVKIATLIQENKQPGNHIIRWNAKEYSKGLYFYQLKIGSDVETRKMILN